jgi:rubrerythrin
MQVLIDWTKNLWHRDLVADPVVHGWVLNLYRAGERYPQTVADYFPAQHAPDRQLADDLRRHRRDEERHTAMYSHAIRGIGQPVIDMDGIDVFNVVIRAFTEESFTITEADDADRRRTKLAHFLAHAHFLEKRVARSLQYHREACERAGATVPERVVEAVLRDEEHHVAYTAAASRALLTHAEAARVFDHHRRAEAKGNLMFSHLQVRAFLRRFGKRPSFYRFCGFLMEQAAAYV